MENKSIELTENNALTSTEEISGIIEAILFVSGDPLPLTDLCEVLEINNDKLNEALNNLEGKLDEISSGLSLLRFSDKVQLSTKNALGKYIDKLYAPKTKQMLSQSAIETLSIIAYRQPITRMEIEEIRGVRCEYAVNVLQQHGLIKEVGRKESLGRPILFGTTERFLRDFSLKSIDDLPNLEELKPTEELQV